MISNDQLEQLCRMQAVAIKAGLDRVRATEGAFLAGAPKPIAEALRRGALAGEPLSDTLSQQGALDPLSVALLSAGEACGDLPAALLLIADRCAERRAHERELIRQLTYPALLLLCVVLIPPIPRIVTDGIGGYLSAVLGPLVGVVASLLLAHHVRSAPATDPVRGAVLRLVTTLPVVSTAVLLAARARFFDALGACVHAGLELHASLEWAGRAAEHPGFARVAEVSARLRAGAALHEALVELNGIDAADRAMVEQAEVAGALDTVLPRISRLHRESARARTSALIRVVGGVVTALVMAAAAYSILRGAVR